MNLFKKKKYVPLNYTQKNTDAGSMPAVPDGMWIKCEHCHKPVYYKSIDKYKICPFCGGYFKLRAYERIEQICDEASFIELQTDIIDINPLAYPDYEKKLESARQNTGMNEAVTAGVCSIHGIQTMLCLMDSAFIMGSLGSAAGEIITTVFEKAAEKRLPVIVFTASGGARMQEGIMSLMQMAKVSAAVTRHSQEGLLYITVLTHPTTGGVTASFAMQGDIILAEPGALVGFAGPRVIRQTINQELPKGFQSSEFLFEHGFVDKVIERPALRSVLYDILRMHKLR